MEMRFDVSADWVESVELTDLNWCDGGIRFAWDAADKQVGLLSYIFRGWFKSGISEPLRDGFGRPV